MLQASILERLVMKMKMVRIKAITVGTAILAFFPELMKSRPKGSDNIKGICKKCFMACSGRVHSLVLPNATNGSVKPGVCR